MEGRALSRPSVCAPTPATRTRGPPAHPRLRIAYGGTRFVASVRLCTDSGHAEAWPSSAPTIRYRQWRDAHDFALVASSGFGFYASARIVHRLRPRGSVALERNHNFVLALEGRASARPPVSEPTMSS